MRNQIAQCEDLKPFTKTRYAKSRCARNPCTVTQPLGSHCISKIIVGIFLKFLAKYGKTAKLALKIQVDSGKIVTKSSQKITKQIFEYVINRLDS